MVKLLLCLISALLLAGLVMQLRQQRLDLAYQNNRIHTQIKNQQAKLWNQQLRIAAYTAPQAIIENVGSHELDMVPTASVPPETRMVMRVTVDKPVRN